MKKKTTTQRVKALTVFGTVEKEGFQKVLKSKILEKYMDDVVELVEAIKKTSKLLAKLEKYYQEIERGDIETIKKFKKLKSKISNEYDIEE